MWVIPALAGAILALSVREWIEWILRRQEKMKTCQHYFKDEDITEYAGMKTRHCSRCPFQEPIKDDET